MTPKPKVADKAREAKPSKVDLSSKNESSPTRPFWMLPMSVRGPTQKSKLAATKPSVKRPCPFKALFKRLAESFQPLFDTQPFAHRPAQGERDEPDDDAGGFVHPSQIQCVEDADQQRGEADGLHHHGNDAFW